MNTTPDHTTTDGSSWPTGAPWWTRSTVYQIYPRSFCDSNGDGIGDLAGITSKLHYLQQLGVDVVWLSPVYASPNEDNGYDISDYCAIQPEFGTLAEFETMLASMHARGIRLMMDLVVNHTSSQHEWFQQARSARDNPFHDFYIWADPVEGREPTNWESVFSGPAWTFNAATGEYYLHMFAPGQPDLNWENPKVRAAVHALMRFWLDKGVDGFRMDVINMISKPWSPDGRLPDAPVCRPGFLQPGFQMSVNGPRLIEFLDEMKREVLAHGDCITVGEAPGATPELALALTDQQQGALNMLFQFDHVSLDCVPGKSKWDLKPLDLLDLKASFTLWQDRLAKRGWNSLYLNNHDQPRALSRYGDDKACRVQSAKLLALLIHGLKGTPYIYQGEEIGMTNYPFEHIEQCQDIESLNMYRDAVQHHGLSPAQAMVAIRAKGRDNARTPMQWSDEPHGGFTQGDPWLAVNPNFTHINAREAIDDEDSVFHFYRQLVALRKRLPVLVHGRYELLLADHPQVYAYTRTLDGVMLVVLCNLSAQDAAVAMPPDLDLSQAKLLLSSWPDHECETSVRALRPYEARLFQIG